MAWYGDGTVSVTNGNTTVNGVGTAWVANVTPGQAIYMPDNRLYEIASVVSNTQITLTRAYQGSTQTGAVYDILPIEGFLQDASDALYGAISEMRSHNEGTLAGRFPAGTNNAPSVRGASDTNTGVNLPGNDMLDLVTGGARRGRLSSAGLQLDVLLNGLAVTQSNDDTTAGRVTKVGDFGPGAVNNVPFVSDLDAQDIPVEFFQFTNAAAGTLPVPGSAGYGLQLRRFGGASEQAAQLVFKDNASRMFFRAAFGGSYKRWFEMYHQGSVLGTVSQSDGVPTGALIERGSNANGSYRKYADGSMECWGIVDLAYVNSGQVGVLQNFPAPFPASFAADRKPNLEGTVCVSESSYTPTHFDIGPVTTANLATGSAQIVVRTVAGASAGFASGDLVRVYWKAKGFWF
ncbi:tail fiber protein [Salipiger pallidus]|uniref:Tail fiber protein n=1 Tax=Salipiger pallidus TaxID=1775170 RepID=A0A8J2ZLH9_9RHOB|nr:hypothetical protein [Salipiger pallidus]GGG77484.1 tail fiber protein [Salipiger pallidus]